MRGLWDAGARSRLGRRRGGGGGGGQDQADQVFFFSLFSENDENFKTFNFRGAPKVTGRTTTSSLVLSLSSLSSGEGGWYSCHASNYLGRDERTRRVDVEGPPAARRMPDVAAVAGRDLWAHCPYGGHPIEGIKWSRGGIP